MKTKRTITAVIVILAALITFILFYIREPENESIVDQNENTDGQNENSLKICSFNIQIFGVSKMEKQDVVDVLVKIISSTDITAVQEVRSTSLEPVEKFMSLLDERYSYVLGPREGRTSSKEQYWVIYNSNAVTVIGEDTYPDPDDIFQRNPLAVYFKAKNGDFDFIIIDNHIQPSDAASEIASLPAVIDYYKEMWNDTDVFVVGDFNADGAYYNENMLAQVFPEPEYYSLISNDWDTTVGVADNTYDRFIITKSAQPYYTGNCGVIRFDEVYDFSAYSIEPKDVSDHYPIWAQFSAAANTTQ